MEKTKPFPDAGFDEVALVQIGADQQKPFFEWDERELPPRCAGCNKGGHNSYQDEP